MVEQYTIDESIYPIFVTLEPGIFFALCPIHFFRPKPPFLGIFSQFVALAKSAKNDLFQKSLWTSNITPGVSTRPQRPLTEVLQPNFGKKTMIFLLFPWFWTWFMHRGPLRQGFKLANPAPKPDKTPLPPVQLRQPREPPHPANSVSHGLSTPPLVEEAGSPPRVAEFH